MVTADTRLQPGGAGEPEKGGGASNFRVVVAGAGFSGLSVANSLLSEGERDFVVLERGHTVGGVWRDNTYPGVACDVPSHLYSFSFAPNPGWDRYFSGGASIQRYLEEVAENRGVWPWIRFGEELIEAAWDDSEELWRITTSRRTLTASVFVSCTGPLTEPRYPDIPGLDRFQGTMLHSSRWDHGHDLTGERVAVVGTGASGVQIIPRIQPLAESLTVFQRTPGWVVPRKDREISAFEKRALELFPALVKLYRLGQFGFRDLLSYRMIRRNPLVRRMFERASRNLLQEQVSDPGLRAKLAPDFEIGCKRVLITDDYYPALDQPNVEVVASGVREVRETSLVAGDGTEREVDAIVFATGFETTESPVLSRIRGRDGRTLDELWDGRPRFHRATTVAGFPNFFNVCGAGTGSGHGSMVFKAESQTAYVMDALRLMRERNLVSVEVSAESQDEYMRRVGEELDETVWTLGGCRSWYLDDAGRPTLMWPRSMLGFRRMLRRFDHESYHLRPASRSALARS